MRMIEYLLVQYTIRVSIVHKTYEHKHAHTHKSPQMHVMKGVMIVVLVYQFYYR